MTVQCYQVMSNVSCFIQIQSEEIISSITETMSEENHECKVVFSPFENFILCM